MTAVLGTLNAVGQGNGFDRVIPVWLGDLAVLAVALVLIVIAFRRNATAYLVPAAIGVIGALSDLNATYVADRTGVGVALLLEGLILIGVGFVADRLRRRLWGERKTGNGVPPPEVPSAPAATEPVPQETATAVEPAAVEPTSVESTPVEPPPPDAVATEPPAMDAALIELTGVEPTSDEPAVIEPAPYEPAEPQ